MDSNASDTGVSSELFIRIIFSKVVYIMENCERREGYRKISNSNSYLIAFLKIVCLFREPPSCMKTTDCSESIKFTVVQMTQLGENELSRSVKDLFPLSKRSFIGFGSSHSVEF